LNKSQALLMWWRLIQSRRLNQSENHKLFVNAYIRVTVQSL